MFIELQRIVKKSETNYQVEPIMVNVSNILFIEDDYIAQKSIKEGKFLGLDAFKSTEFCTITFKSGSEINNMLALGNKNQVATRIREAKFEGPGNASGGRKLLNG